MGLRFEPETSRTRSGLAYHITEIFSQRSTPYLLDSKLSGPQSLYGHSGPTRYRTPVTHPDIDILAPTFSHSSQSVITAERTV